MKNDKIIKIIRVAKKYYESHMDQKIIAQEEKISVSTVSRMLKKAEEMGVAPGFLHSQTPLPAR